MTNLSVCVSVLVFAACVPANSLGQDTRVDGDTYGDRLGTVDLRASCSEEARPHVDRGAALLHHMTYEGAEQAFAAATDVDPECALGYWGQAMTYIHPLWSDPPGEAAFERGQSLVDSARSRGQKTDREQAYISAVEAYYAHGWSPDERPRLVSFAQGWQNAHQAFPDDPEAKSFYALAHLSTADPEDKTYATQLEAGALAEQVLAMNPKHPGAHHYVIHSYDYPALAEKALEVARSYGDIAPAVPHALHMPSHIFIRRGLWQESIDWNRRSADAALENTVGGAVSMHYLHALDYLAYAYLQRGEDQKAKQILDELAALDDPLQTHLGAAYALAAVPARFALERHQWGEATLLDPRMPDTYPWDAFPAMEAITHFARALGAARSGDLQVAEQALGELSALGERAAEASAYWAKQAEIQRLSAAAWLAYEKGDERRALRMMRRAADMEASTEKHPVTPGEVLPARELLADMLLEMGHYKEAQREYEAALERSANRFNSLYGAGRAAELAGDESEAAHYYEQLAAVTSDADTERDRLQRARTFSTGQ